MTRPNNNNHIIALSALVILALIKAWYSWSIGFEHKWTGDTSDTFLRIVNTAQTTQATSDGRPLIVQIVYNQMAVVQNLPIRNWYQGAFDSYLQTVLMVTGDISLAYKLLVFPLNLLFLSGAYLLCLKLGLSIRGALVLAVLTSLHFSISWAGEKMGIGPVWTFSRRHIFTAFLPWLTLGFLLYRDRYLHTALLFGVCGLVANLHASGLLLIQILSLTWLLGAPISPMRACKAMLLLIIGHLTAFYALGSIWGRALENISALLLGGMLTSSYAETLFPVLETAKSAMPAALQYLSYPPREYDHWPRIIIDAWFAATILAGLLILPTKRWLPEHFPHILFLATILSLLFVSANEFGTLVLIGSLLYFSRVPHSDNNAKLHTVSLLIVVTYWISVVGGIAFQVAHVSIQGFPLVWDQFRGMRFLGFFVFLWLGVLWSTPSRSILPRWYKSALALALLVFIFGQIKTFERQHVRYSNSEEFAKRAALLEIAQWARNHTPSDSLFLVGSSGFGITANRRVTHSDKSIQGPDAPPLAPKHSPSSTEALKYAHSLHATHAVLGASKDKNTENPCTLVANHQFQLAEIRCLEQQPTLQK